MSPTLSMLDSRAFDEARAEMIRKSRKNLYKRDFDAWSSDVLGRRYYEKFRQINAQMVSGLYPRVAVKSANGCGKSLWLADWGTYWGTVWPPEDSLAIFTANGRDQIERVVFKYLKDNYGYARSNGNQFIGQINESLEWKYDKTDGSGKEQLVFGKRPADQDIVSSFQGTRKKRTMVGMDEAGGLPTDIFTAAEAVTTGEESLTIAIGNPDRRATEFHKIFSNKQTSDEWLTHTISAYDLPTMTGEIVYPEDPEKQARMLAGLTSKKWIFHKERAWKIGGDLTLDEESGLMRNLNGKKDARFLAKVDGEFPGETDNSFFPEDDLEKCYDLDLAEAVAGMPIVMGVDVAAMGTDESVVYVNQGGRIRLFEKTVTYDDGGETRSTTGVWSKEDEVTSARRIHAIAMYLGASEVRIDAAGMGGGISSMLMRLAEFNGKCYELLRVDGSWSSEDKARWQIARDQNHDNLKSLMHDGKIDLDRNDTLLHDELLIITYALNNHGAVKITGKREMRTELGGSPDRTDAAIYAALDASVLIDNPLRNLKAGDKVAVSAWDLLQQAKSGRGRPM